uniref:ANK_REP_REGION domain-containing protein n=1 Tax=Macrostomum lignano TaxID=282301 RepID=A0A1I8FBS5_9PLAT
LHCKRQFRQDFQQLLPRQNMPIERQPEKQQQRLPLPAAATAAAKAARADPQHLSCPAAMACTAMSPSGPAVADRCQHTRVETELQPTGATADLNINIIMDSDSNLSNASERRSEDIGAPSGGIDALRPWPPRLLRRDASAGSAGCSAGPSSLSDTTGGRDPASGGSAGGGGPSDDASGERRRLAMMLAVLEAVAAGDPLVRSQPKEFGIAPAQAAALAAAPEQNAQSASSEAAQPVVVAGCQGCLLAAATSPISAPVASPSEEETPTSLPPGAASPRRAEADDDEDDEDDDEEEGGEGEEGDMDDAQRHFQRYLDGEKWRRGREKATSRGIWRRKAVVIGCMSVFADVHLKEYIVVPVRCKPDQVRNRGGDSPHPEPSDGPLRWLKYLIVDIRGRAYSAIDHRYGAPAMVSMFLKETTPDNTDLYFNFQRTGPSQRMSAYGEIPLRAPFRKTKTRPVETTPWEATVMSHVYPESRGAPGTTHQRHWTTPSSGRRLPSKRLCDDARRRTWPGLRCSSQGRWESEPLFANVLGD